MTQYQITSGTLSFTVEESGGIIVDASPLARWAIGKSIKEVLEYYKKDQVIKVR